MMFNMHSIFKFFKPKRIAFIDGDQELLHLLRAYSSYIAGTNTETHFIRQGTYEQKPKALKKHPEIKLTCIEGMRHGKEVTDKYIGAFIQKSINDGYKDITVISSDYDFIDIFKMAVLLNKKASNIKFKMIIPRVKAGRLAELPSQLDNIEIVKIGKVRKS